MSSDTYDTILQVAGRLFSQHGYTATSMRQIAQEAGIGKATIYHHFPDKRAIVSALLSQGVADIQEMLETIKAEKDPRRRIEITTETSIHFLLESVMILQIARREVPGARAQMISGYTATLQQFRAQLAEALQQGIDQGIFRPHDPAEAARVLQTMIQGTFAVAYLGERPLPPEKTAASLLDIFFHGVEKR